MFSSACRASACSSRHAQAAGVDIPVLDPPTFPVIVKPDRPIEFKRRYKRQAFRCENAAELEDALARTEEFGPIVQEFVPGGDDTLYTVGSYLTRDGRALGIFCGRKLRQTPPASARAVSAKPSGSKKRSTPRCGCCAAFGSTVSRRSSSSGTRVTAGSG